MRVVLPPYARLPSGPSGPNAAQRAFHAGRARHKFFRGGVGSGKSRAGAWELFRSVVRNAQYLNERGLPPGALYLVGAPEYRLVNGGIYKHITSILDEASGLSGFNVTKKIWTTSPRRIQLVTGDEIVFFSTKHSEMLASDNAVGCLYDESELADDPMAGYSALEARVRDPRFPPDRYFAHATSTPRGYRGLSAYFADQIAAGDADYAMYQARTADNQAMSVDYQKRLASKMSERERLQQLEGELVTEAGAVYGLEYDDALSVDHAWRWLGRPRRDHTYTWAIDWGSSYHGVLMEHSPYYPGTERRDPLGGFDTAIAEVVLDGVQDEQFLEELFRVSDKMLIPRGQLTAWSDYNPVHSRKVANAPAFFAGRCSARRVGQDGDKERGINVVRWRLRASDGTRRLRFAAHLRNTPADRKILRCMTNYTREEALEDGQVIRLGVKQRSPYSHGPDALRAYLWPKYESLRIGQGAAAA